MKSLDRARWWRLFGGVVFVLGTLGGLVRAGDLSVVPWINGEQIGATNTWGGPWGTGNVVSVRKEATVVHAGQGAFQADLGTLPVGSSRFFQSFASGFGATSAYRQTRDVTRYDRLEGYVRNDTGTPLTLTLELKDYRDSSSHRAQRRFTVPANSTWTPLSTSFDLGPAWTVTGTPDLSRTFAVSFLINNPSGPASGSMYLDDLNFVEQGPTVDLATSPVSTLAERLAERQFAGLWASRQRTSGILPNSSDNPSLGAINVTAGVVWMLPAAIRHQWVSAADADAYLQQLVTTLNHNLDQTQYLPSRFVDYVSGAPVGDREESSVDASFLALALHSYKTQTHVSGSLHNAIDTLENRFDFAAFVRPQGFDLAYRPANGFTNSTYNGYTHEGKLVSLAAELSTAHHVDLADYWNRDTLRSAVSLVDPDRSHLVHTSSQFRAPFEQALLNLFVDTSDRGADNFPNRELARNPWQNFLRYEEEVNARLQQLGRGDLFQPDAGQSGSSAGYRQFSLYNDFGQADLLMPWSGAFALWAGADGAASSLRKLLDQGMNAPLGMADFAHWATGADQASAISGTMDHWNVALSTMALLEYLDGSDRASRQFANLSEVKSALDQVFVAGDFTGDGIIDLLDHEYLRTTYGSRRRLAADGDNNGVIDAGDFDIWRDAVPFANRPYFGDADRDGEFNSGDLVEVFQAGTYESLVQRDAAWGTGDWDADGDFTTADLIVAFQDGGYEQGPRAARVAAVPEPAVSSLALSVASVVWRRRRNHRVLRSA